jgi:HEAT repeat protein
MFAVTFAALLALPACADYHAGQSNQRAEDPNAAIEANIHKLTEAQQKLSANPHDATALSVILKLLKDPNGINRSNAAHTLGEVGAEHGDIIKTAAIPLLIEMAEHGDGGDRYAAVKALRSFGPHAAAAKPLLRQTLESPVEQMRCIAAETLGRMKGAAADAVPDLVKTIQEHKAECRNDELHICRCAIQALGNIGPPAREAKRDLIRLLTDENVFLRAYAAVAVIRIEPRTQEPLPVIAILLADPNVEVRRRIIWELKDAGREAKPAEASVRAALRDSDEAVRQAASDLLKLL